MIFISVLFAAFAPSAWSCGEIITLDSTRPTYTFTSPGYPLGQTFAQCEWTINAPTAQSMSISCPVIDMSTFLFCFFNPIFVIVNDKRYWICGSDTSAAGSADVTSFGVKYSYNFFNTRNTKGFTCTASFIPAPTNPTPPNSVNCPCGIENPPLPRIVGGVEANPNQFPWMTPLLVTAMSGRSMCGASLISPEWVLTAAHCVDGGVQPSQIEFRFGEHSLSGTENPQPIIRKGKQIFVHPNWNARLSVNDIALVKIDPVSRTREISPICLPFKSKAISGKARATGWGLTLEGGSISPILQVVEMDLHTASECRAINGLSSSFITDDMICASGPGKDSCQGDSGGPLFVREGNNNIIVGIVSKGPGCARPNTAGIYTKVDSFIDWIESTTRESFCKI